MEPSHFELKKDIEKKPPPPTPLRPPFQNKTKQKWCSDLITSVKGKEVWVPNFCVSPSERVSFSLISIIDDVWVLSLPALEVVLFSEGSLVLSGQTLLPYGRPRVAPSVRTKRWVLPFFKEGRGKSEVSCLSLSKSVLPLIWYNRMGGLSTPCSFSNLLLFWVFCRMKVLRLLLFVVPGQTYYDIHEKFK